MRFKGHCLIYQMRLPGLTNWILRILLSKPIHVVLNQLCSSLWTSSSWLEDETMFWHTQNFSRRKFRLGNVLESQKKIFFATRPPSFLFYKLVSSTLWPFCCFLLMYVRLSRQKKAKHQPPPGREIFCWPRWIGNSTRRYCYRDATPTNVFCKDMKRTIEFSYAYIHGAFPNGITKI